MEDANIRPKGSALLTVLIWGGLWGIFEATVGYLVHLLPFSVGWFVWYPVACFFMYNVYRQTGRTGAVLLVGSLSACIKLLNLFLPGRIDRVLNPAISIALEALAMAAVLLAVKHFLADRGKRPLIKASAVLCMNTGWRLLYALYLAWLAPGWIRDISVISNAEALCTFFLVHNLFTSVLLFGASMAAKYIMRPIQALEYKVSAALSTLSCRTAARIKVAAAICLLSGSIALGMLL